MIGTAGRFFASLLPAEQKRYEAMIATYSRAQARMLSIKDERLQALPHHRRLALENAMVEEARFVEVFAPKVAEMARDPNATRHDVMMTMRASYPLLFSAVYQGLDEVLLALALRLMVHYGRVRVFQTTNALETMLHATDFGEDIPAAWFRIPYPAVYVEFGEERAFPVRLEDPQSGSHVVEGAYLFEGSIPSFESGELVRGFDIIIFGSAAGKANAMDDTFVHFGLPIEDEQAPLARQVENAIEHYARLGYHNFPNQQAMRPILEHLGKVLVYLNTREARSVEKHEASAFARKASNIKSPGKREKAMRQAARLYDRIVIGPETLSDGAQAGNEATAAVRPHVRRGHIRMQACGPRHSERRPIWLEPMFINGFHGSKAANPVYLVR